MLIGHEVILNRIETRYCMLLFFVIRSSSFRWHHAVVGSAIAPERAVVEENVPVGGGYKACFLVLFDVCEGHGNRVPAIDIYAETTICIFR